MTLCNNGVFDCIGNPKTALQQELSMSYNYMFCHYQNLIKLCGKGIVVALFEFI